MTVLGAIFRPASDPERLRAAAEAADRAGLEELWLWEDCFFAGGMASAAAALASTGRLRVGVGVLPVPLRNVALTTMEVAALARMFPGRFMPGFGHGVQDWMGQVGARVESPTTLLREQLTAMRGLLHGERLSTEGRYVRLTDVVLDWPPESPPPLLVGTGGPRSLRLSGAHADGTILTARTRPDDVRRARELVDEGRADAGRTDRHELVLYLPAAIGQDATRRVHAELAADGDPPVPEYAEAVTLETILSAARNLVDAGADRVILQPTADEPDPVGFVRFAAEEVAPALARAG